MFSDAELIQKIRSSNISERNAALKNLYGRGEVRRTVQNLVQQANHRPDADDILQEGMILFDEIIRGGRFQGNSSLTTFLIGICRNLIRNKVRTAEKLVMQEDMGMVEIKEKEMDGHKILELSESEAIRDKILRGLFNDLSDGCREALRLYYYEAYNMAQVALERGLANANRAANTMQRCREQLRDLITQHPNLITHLKY